MMQDLYQLDLISNSNSCFDNIRGLLFPALFEEENNLVRIKELASHSQQNELLKRLILVKVNQNFDQKSSNLYRELALNMGFNLNIQIQESSYFEQQEVPTFQEHIEDQQNGGKLKRSSSFSNDENGQHIQENMMFYEIQNLFFGRIPLYVKSFLSSKKEYYQIHNQFNRVFFMDQNPFDLSSIYLIINSVCSFMECEYASNLFKSIQDFNNSQKQDQNLIPISEHDNAPKLDCLISNFKDNLLVELVQSLLAGEQINEKIRVSFTNQQIYFAFFLVMHVSKICTLSFGLGIKNEIDLGYFKNQEQNKTSFQINQEENGQSYCQNQQNCLNQFLQCQDCNLCANNIPSSIALDETTIPSSNSTEIQEDELFSETIFEEVGQREKIQSKLHNNIDKNIEYQEFCISSIEPFLSSSLLYAIDESHRCLKTEIYPFEELLQINKEHLQYYVQCLLHIKNYQQNPKILEQIPPEIKNFIKYLVFYPNKIDKKIAHGLKKHLQSFEAFSQFVQFITDCLLFANLNVFEYQNQF
ncbi:hypothetical protein TTHERM_00136500 (macronuclear) [Tetrahymena thermophila SB210]|uniref:Uncharacterized protein n=1 Tax=Tetrahymena thermophila (strain SB210) TaxID=312017 RepID=I7M278_TETTS|nr:hypothetical protein TTHERM_00136500 [Tetrahymena thermophila SB210]EAR99486.1 hypothetical protein TTHERM_00136500 [Tetrahymena thermophila SB210]|eukprot:XP_001019731.1 hypothetical protein TTHERM_00136500 [Tetrahymena thermophila SB210]